MNEITPKHFPTGKTARLEAAVQALRHGPDADPQTRGLRQPAIAPGNMEAILIADRNPAAGLPDSCPALLPVAGKPIIEYSLEELADAGVRCVTVFVGSDAQALREFLGDGTRWGLQIRIAYSRGDEPAADLLKRLAIKTDADRLVLRGDEMRGRGLQAFLDATNVRNAPIIAGCDAEDRVTYYRVRGAVRDLSGLSRTTAASSDTMADCTIVLPDVRSVVVDSPAAYLAANAGVLSGRLQNLVLAGLASGTVLRSGRLSSARASQVENGHAHIGDRVQLHPSVRLCGKVSVGDDCYIDHDTILENCVVLPGTYVGAGLTLRDAVIAPGRMTSARSGRRLPVPDTLWLGAIGAARSPWRTPVSERLLAATLFLLSLPLSLVAAMASVLKHPRAPLQRQLIGGNHLDANGRPMMFATRRWLSGPRSLRALPGLLDVVTGQLRLFGARPANPEDREDSDTRFYTSRIAAGHWSAARLLLPVDAPDEEIALNELQLAEATTAQRCGVALSALFHRPRPGAVGA